LGSADDSDAVDAVVETGESSKEPDEVDVMVDICAALLGILEW